MLYHFDRCLWRIKTISRAKIIDTYVFRPALQRGSDENTERFDYLGVNEYFCKIAENQFRTRSFEMSHSIQQIS